MSRTNVPAVCALVWAQLLLPGVSVRAQQAGPAAATRAILPAAPADLLACLPAAPAGWTMMRSNAASTYFQWLTTMANRDFKQNPPPFDPDAAVPPKPFVPGILSVHLADGGYSTNYAASFVPPASGAAKNTTFLEVGGYPARRDTADDGTETLSLLVKGRFVIDVRGTNMPETGLLDYLTRVNYRRLLAIPDTGPHAVPQPVMVTRIDELDPKQNRTYPLYWATPKQK